VGSRPTEDILIKVYEPFRATNTEEYVLDCLRSNWISSRGDYLHKFAQRLEGLMGAKNVSLVSNGTVALHLALLAAGVGRGDEVICPVLTYVASANSIRYVNATPVFVDVLHDTWTIDVNEVERAITPKTKAIMLVHLYGIPCEIDKVTEIANKYNLFVIEDCAESFGSKYNGMHTGTFGDFATFSFFGNKTITTGEGGCVISRTDTGHELIENLKNQGVHAHTRYDHSRLGYNYRMTNIQAAIGCAQLDDYELIVNKKRSVHEYYLKNTADSYSFQQWRKDSEPVVWMTVTLCRTPEVRRKIESQFIARGIEWRPIFKPLNMVEHLKADGSFDVARDLSERGINLPSGPSLTEVELNTVTDILNNA
jgi:perosamine synthetase